MLRGEYSSGGTRDSATTRVRPVRTLALGVALAAAGCQTYRPDVMLEHYELGELDAAYEEIADPPWYRGHYDHDEVIWLLEEGKVLRDLERYDESSAVFERALDLFEQYVLFRPDISVTEEVTSILGSQVTRDYRGSFADAIMATTLVALNDLAVGNVQNARSAAQRSYNFQKEAEIYFEEELQRAEELADDQQIDDEAILADEEVQAELATADALIGNGQADILNPLAAFVEAIANFAAVTTADRGIKALEAAAEMVPGNSHVRALLDGTVPTADRTVYVIYERGMAPAREEFRVTVPSPAGVATVAIPVLRPRADRASHLRLTSTDGALDLVTEPLANVDAIIATQFKKDLPGIIVRTIISTVIKEGATYAANKAVEGTSIWVRIGVFLGGIFYKAATSGADIRSWQTIGSEFQVAALTLPDDGTLDVELIDTSGQVAGSRTVRLPAAPITVVCARSIGLTTFRVALPVGVGDSNEFPSGVTP